MGEEKRAGPHARYSSAFIDDEHSEISQKLLAANINMGIGDRIEADDVGFTDFPEEIADDLVKAIVADFDAISVANGFGADLFVRVFRDFERGERLFD